MLRFDLLAGCALPLMLAAAPAAAQDLQNRPADPPPAPTASTSPVADDQVQFSAGSLEYDTNTEVVTALGDVRMFRTGNRLRADKVVWNRKTGKVVATGDIAVTNPQGDIAYGDSIELTDSLKDGMVDNMLVVLEQGGRMAARQGTRDTDGTVELQDAAYTPCAVTNSAGCPKEPSWKITAVRITYRPDKGRIYYQGGRFHLFSIISIPLPSFSHPIGGAAESGFLSPDARYSRVNGLEVATPYYFRLAPNRGLTITPHVFSGVLPMLQADYSQLTSNGAFRVTGYATESRRSDDFTTETDLSTERAFRGYLGRRRPLSVQPAVEFVGIAPHRLRSHVPAPLRHFARRPAAQHRDAAICRRRYVFRADRLGGADAARQRRARHAAARAARTGLPATAGWTPGRQGAGAGQHAGAYP